MNNDSHPPPAIRAIFFLLALIAPVLMGFVVYLQWNTPAVDCTLDWRTGVILDVPQDSNANYAGLQSGDRILSMNDIPFAEWKGVERDVIHAQNSIDAFPLCERDVIHAQNSIA
jgi:predicted metalloprotease with PDZ domain